MAYQKITSHDEYLEIVEKYQDYEAGTYQSMTLKEKMDFFDGIHTDNVPLFDEDGDDLETADDYASIKDEFLNHPEQFSLEDISAFLEMLDDSCYQPSFMDTILTIIHNIVKQYQSDGVVYLLTHLHEVPARGYGYGLFFTLRQMMEDDETYQLMKNAVGLAASDDLRLIQKIFAGKDMPEVLGPDGKTSRFPVFDECGDEKVRKRKQELENLIAPLVTVQK